MAKRRKPSVSFSVESLREEVEVELTNKKVATNVSQDLRSIRLDSVDFVSPDVLLCALTVKFGILRSFYPLPVFFLLFECYRLMYVGKFLSCSVHI